MSALTQPEYWLRGPVENIPSLLQPVAHALLQARDEIREVMSGFPEEKLWIRPAGLASAAFHLQHIPGVLDRLFTYAGGEQLSQLQLDYLKAEGKEDKSASLHSLLQQIGIQVEKALEQLSRTDEKILTETRGVGRRQIPSTVMGLLFHAAEHMQRHNGQLLVTVKMIRAFPGLTA